MFAIKLAGKKAKDLVFVLAVPGSLIALWNMADKVSEGKFKAKADNNGANGQAQAAD